MTPLVSRIAAVAVLAPLLTLLPASPAPAADWKPPATLSRAGGGGHVTLADLAVGPRGDAVATWVQTRPGGYQVRVATRGPHGPWSRARALTGWFRFSSSGPASYGGRPEAGIDGHGAATVAWSQPDGGTVRVRVASRSASGRWSAPRWLSPTGKLGVNPQVVGSAAGTVVSWQQGRPFGDPQVQARYRGHGGSWTRSERLDSGPWIPLGTTVGVVDGAGTATLVWDENAVRSGGGGRLRVATYLPGSGWSVATLFRRTNHAHQPQVDVTADGTVTVAWADYDQILVARRAPGAAWSAPEGVAKLGSGALPDLVGVGVSATGATLVGWTRLDLPTGRRGDMLSVQPAPGAAWSREQVSRPAAEPFLTPFRPALAVDDHGGATMTWEVQNSLAHRWYRVYVRHRAPSGAWSRPARLGRVTSSEDIAVDARGTVTALWLEGRRGLPRDSCCTAVRARVLPADD